jgi:signal peptidase I
MKKKAGRHLGRTMMAAFAVALALKSFCFDFMITEGQSMYPAIKNGTVLVINKLAYGLRLPWNGRYALRWALPKAGDVVVFYTPLGSLAVKRCAELRPDNRFLAAGDNSAASYDSRSYGPVPLDNIVGRTR